MCMSFAYLTPFYMHKNADSPRLFFLSNPPLFLHVIYVTAVTSIVTLGDVLETSTEGADMGRYYVAT